MTECFIPHIGIDTLGYRLDAHVGKSRLAYSGAIEITPYCNMKCVHCYISHCHWEGNILSCAEICRILDEVADEGCLFPLLTGGEPMLRDDFLDIYTHAKKKGMFVTIFTNGTLVTPEIARYLHDWSPHSVEVSIYGATAATHDGVTGVAGSFERCIRGIGLLVEQGIPLVVKTMIMNQNKHEYWEMKKLVKGFGVRFRADPILNPSLDGSLHPFDLRLTPEEVVKLDMDDPERRHSFIETYKVMPMMPPPRPYVYTCGAGIGRFHIDSFGRLQMCTLSRHPDYDLRRGSFREGWHTFLPGIAAQKLEKPSLCRTCEDRKVCVMCAGWAQLAFGTLQEQPVEYLCRICSLRSQAIRALGQMNDSAAAANESALIRPPGRDNLTKNKVERD